MKKGILGTEVKPLLKEVVDTPGWALCVGAGISLPVFPSWAELVKKLIKRIEPDETVSLSKELLENFGADALIQAAYNLSNYEGEDGGFSDLLSEVLYEDLRAKLSKEEWDIYCSAVLSLSPGTLSGDKWRKMLILIEKHLSSMTGTILAQELASIIDTKLAPSEILSFNAESTFLATLNAYIWDQNHDDNGQQVKKYVDVITRGISSRNNRHIPMIYCHGYVYPQTDVNIRDIYPSEKLVFSENEYLQLANNAFSWQSSEFLNICCNKRVLFIGVSMSDPNMRRWLSWVHANRIEEIRQVYGSKKPSTNHYWINRIPSSKKAKRWIEASLAHLGVRIVWIEDWAETRMVFRRMLGL